MTLNDKVLIAGMVAETLVLGMLLYRKVWRTLPLFCGYILWSLLTDASVAIVKWKFPDQFLHVYFIEIVPDSLLQFGVLIELAWSVLRPSKASLPKGSIYVLSFLVLLAGALIWPLAGFTTPPSSPILSKHAVLFIHFQQTVSILRVVCFLIMAGFSQILAIGWKDRELQVATGLGFFSIAGLIVAVLHQHQDPAANLYNVLDTALIFCYLGTLAYWVLSFSTKEQERREFSPQMQQILVQMGGGARTDRIALTNIPPKPPRKRD